MTREDGGLPHTCLEPRMLGDRVGREDLGLLGGKRGVKGWQGDWEEHGSKR